MTRRCYATQRDNHARRIIRRRIKGKMIRQTKGMCTAWFRRTVRAGTTRGGLLSVFGSAA